ncbi:hypothetical protein C0Q70_21406 [Pomacea canaliculata]|uniref:Uncharacterized protein n=1 Tax=Pomacea canaliculata TaxID=400727 RepID=A0A2T7NCF0_POMCA|nr:hypothetical protein C0Q70_21406 [Pomacea canaliculata]
MIFLSVTGSAGGQASVVVSKDCRYLICTSQWDNARQEAATTVSVVASKTEIQDGTKDLLVSFANLVVADPSPYQQIFQGFKIPSVQRNHGIHLHAAGSDSDVALLRRA